MHNFVEDMKEGKLKCPNSKKRKPQVDFQSLWLIDNHSKQGELIDQDGTTILNTNK